MRAVQLVAKCRGRRRSGAARVFVLLVGGQPARLPHVPRRPLTIRSPISNPTFCEKRAAQSKSSPASSHKRLRIRYLACTTALSVTSNSASARFRQESSPSPSPARVSAKRAAKCTTDSRSFRTWAATQTEHAQHGRRFSAGGRGPPGACLQGTEPFGSPARVQAVKRSGFRGQRG
jgi:hypothetical protein